MIVGFDHFNLRPLKTGVVAVFAGVVPVHLVVGVGVGPGGFGHGEGRSPRTPVL